MLNRPAVDCANAKSCLTPVCAGLRNEMGAGLLPAPIAHSVINRSLLMGRCLSSHEPQGGRCLRLNSSTWPSRR